VALPLLLAVAVEAPVVAVEAPVVAVEAPVVAVDRALLFDTALAAALAAASGPPWPCAKIDADVAKIASAIELCLNDMVIPYLWFCP
jgi:hypothetical protein